MGERPSLRLIPGGHPEVSVGSVKVVAAPEATPPFEVDARAFEDFYDLQREWSADSLARLRANVEAQQRRLTESGVWAIPAEALEAAAGSDA